MHYLQAEELEGKQDFLERENTLSFKHQYQDG